jgi:hypothetical protein
MRAGHDVLSLSLSSLSPRLYISIQPPASLPLSSYLSISGSHPRFGKDVSGDETAQCRRSLLGLLFVWEQHGTTHGGWCGRDSDEKRYLPCWDDV